MKHTALYCLAVCLFALQPIGASCQEVFEAAQSPGVEAEREATTVRLHISPEVKSPIVIPRIAAPLNTMRVTNPATGDRLRVVPLQDKWEIHWRRKGDGHLGVEMHFDAAPYLPSELKPIQASGDGSFSLPAHLAKTQGKNIRYEPQTFKNTVGYWTGKNDTATWSFKLDKPGRFNVAVLQGCAKGQGGTAQISFEGDGKRKVAESIEFEVLETGHFQNFQWRHLGEVRLTKAGEVSLVVSPKQFKRSALMDIRAIHLIRLPDK